MRSEGRDFKGWLEERIQEYLATSRDSEPPASDLSNLEKRVLEAALSDGRTQHYVDDLMQATGLGVAQVSEALPRLELRGRAVQHFGLYRPIRPS